MPEGGFKTLCAGSCVGHKRIETFEKTAVKSLRLVIDESAGCPAVRRFSAYGRDVGATGILPVAGA